MNWKKELLLFKEIKGSITLANPLMIRIQDPSIVPFGFKAIQLDINLNISHTSRSISMDVQCDNTSKINKPSSNEY